MNRRKLFQRYKITSCNKKEWKKDRTYTKGNIRYYRKEYYINLIMKL